MIPDDYLSLIQSGNAYATFATTLPDKTPHQTVTWIDYDGSHLLINTAPDRRKVKNVRRNPRASVTVVDPADPHTYISVMGTVEEITSQDASRHATELGRRYGELSDDETFTEIYGSSERVILRIAPTEYFTH